MKLRIRPIHLLLGLTLLLTSCARYCGDMAYWNTIDANAAKHTYDGPNATQIWTETRGILAEYGYSDPDISAPPVEDTYLTEWVGEPRDRSRLSVRILRVDPRKHRLHIHEIREYEDKIYPPGYDPYDPNAAPLDPADIRYETRTSRTRKQRYEWEVLQRVDPDEALLIEGEALRRRDATREVVASGCQ